MILHRKAAHFLLQPELLYSPPNDAIIKCLLSLGYEVHIFAPGLSRAETEYGQHVIPHQVIYSYRWILRNLVNPFWLNISLMCATSEDPFAAVGLLSLVYRLPFFLLVDEIKAGSYRGDRPKRWKKICIWTIKRAKFCIVNDATRINLLANYANLSLHSNIIVYPGCYFTPPQRSLNYRESQRIKWGVPKESTVIASSGGFNLTAGADWLLKSLRDRSCLYAVIQPLGIDSLSMFLLHELTYNGQLYIEKDRLSWLEAWMSAVAFDIGLAIYTNPAPQFQNMGISSNRLCMYIAMGVPVICSRQASFEFVEQYHCGILVSTYEQFLDAVDYIRLNQSSLRENCVKCYEEYIQPMPRYEHLRETIIHSFSHTELQKLRNKS